MSIGFLRLSISNHTSYKNVVWLKFSVFMNTIFGTPDDNSKLIFITGWWMNFMNRSRKPLFLGNQLNPSLKSALRTISILRVQISKLDRFFFNVKMPFSVEVSLFKVDLSVPKSCIYILSKYIMTLHNLDSNCRWTRQIKLNLLANIVLRIILASNNRISSFDLLPSIDEFQKCGRFHIVIRNQRLAFKNINSTHVFLWPHESGVIGLLLCGYLWSLTQSNQF